MTQLVHFYQTGTFTAGNRLLDPEDRSIQSSMERFNSLTSGHRACQGCGEALGARYAVDAAMRAVNGRLAAANATGCLEVFSTPYPETSSQLPWLHSLFRRGGYRYGGGLSYACQKDRQTDDSRDCSRRRRRDY